MPRPYKQATPVTVEGGWGIALDGRALKTPGRNPLIVPSRALAEAIAAEWQAQDARSRPLSMPLTRLAMTAIDRVRGARQPVIAEIVAYGGTDLLCHRVGEPAALAERQRAAWQPLLEWLARRFGVRLKVTQGVMAVPQREADLKRLRAAIAARDDFALAALRALAQTAGSVVVALAVAEGELDAEAAFAVSALDELYQAEQWGEDGEAATRRAALRDDLAMSARFLKLLKG